MSAADLCVACGCSLAKHPDGGPCTTEAGAIDACPCNAFVTEKCPADTLEVRIGGEDEGYLVRLPATGWARGDDVRVKVIDWRCSRTSSMLWQTKYQDVMRDESEPKFYQGEHYNGTFRRVLANALAPLLERR